MKKVFIYILLIFFVSLKLFAVEAIDPYENTKFFLLENGMKVYLSNDEQANKTQVVVEVKVGTNSENNETAGISHLLEHLIFRDERIPTQRYISYLKDEGATYINGYTSQNITEYIASIDSKKSYWLVKTFFDMIFDKKINENDLKVVKNSMKVEIGDMKWYHTLVYHLNAFINWTAEIFPSALEMYYHAFSLEHEHTLPTEFYSIKNNKIFTLAQLMKHYDEYYYPSNMSLKIIGNFDEQKMKETISNTFGKVKRMGIKK